MAQTEERPLSTFTEGLATEWREQRASYLREMKAELKRVFTAENAGIDAELKALEGNGSPSERAGNGHTAPSSARRSRARTAAKRSTAATPGPTSDQVLGAIRAGSVNAPQIAKRLGSKQQTVARRLRALADAGAVRREGSGGNTRWVILAQGTASGQRFELGTQSDAQAAAA